MVGTRYSRPALNECCNCLVMMNRRACASYQRSGSLPAMELKTYPLFSKPATLEPATMGHSTGVPLPLGIGSPASIYSSSTSSSVYSPMKKVHFERSSARKALSSLKHFTNNSVRSIKEHYRAHHRKDDLPHHIYPSNWISDAAQQSDFVSPRSLKPPPSPLRSCLRRVPSCTKSMRSAALREELCYFEDTVEDLLDRQSGDDDVCLIDDLVDQRLINSMWVPLNPVKYAPLCIDDIKDLF